MSLLLYQETMQMYTTQLRGLFAAPPRATAEQEAARRGAGVAVAPTVLAERVDQLATVSQQLGTMTIAYLDDSDQGVREVAEMKLLAQANAEVEAALAMLHVAGSTHNAQGQGAGRAQRAAGIQSALDELADILGNPLEQGMQPFLAAGALRGARVTDPAKARQELKDQVRRSLRSISRQATRTGSRALDTLLRLDATILQQGVTLISKEASELLDKLVSGLNEIIKRLVVSAMRLLLQAYDWVLALIGKDVAHAARQKMHAWIEELRGDFKKKGDETSLAEKLVTTIFDPDTVNADVARWLETSKASGEAINQTTTRVEQLAASYEAKANRVEGFLRLAGIARSLPLPVANLPLVQLGVAAVVLGLMGYILFAGYDYIDSGALNFFNRFSIHIPDRVEGVREVTMKALVAT